jgi:hypothetical protein
MINLLSGVGLRSEVTGGAQTERRGDAGPVGDLAWRRDLIGRLVSGIGEAAIT